MGLERMPLGDDDGNGLRIADHDGAAVVWQATGTNRTDQCSRSSFVEQHYVPSRPPNRLCVFAQHAKEVLSRRQMQIQILEGGAPGRGYHVAHHQGPTILSSTARVKVASTSTTTANARVKGLMFDLVRQGPLIHPQVCNHS